MITSDVVDSHHHLWDLRHSYPWLQEAAGRLQVHGDDTRIRHDYLVGDFLQDAGELPLRKSVHVDAGAADSIAEAEWVQKVADEHGYPHAIVAGVRLVDPDVGEQLDRLCELPNLRGVRDILNWHPDPRLTYVDRSDLMTDRQWLAGFRLIESRGLSFDMQLYPQQMDDAVRLASRHPSSRIRLNHCAMPVDRSPEGMRIWRKGLHALAAQDNVLVKLSGIGMTDHRWMIESLRPIVLECIDAFGPSRAMFGSNFPVDSLYSTYRQLYDAFDSVTADFTDDERRQLFGATAAAAYRI